MKRIVLVLITLVLLSCNKEEHYSKESLLKKAQKADPEVTVILPRSMSEGVHCGDYPPGCIAAHIVRVKGLDMIIVEFSTNTEAQFAAKKVRGYYARNWLLDDVMGEPVLVKFVTEHLGAKLP